MIKCANPKCDKEASPNIDYCNLYCYRDHLQQLQDSGEFNEQQTRTISRGN